jgi:hypothetical protein
MSQQNESISQHITNLLEDGQGREQIEKHLREQGHDERFVTDIVKEAITLYDAKRRSQGLTLILSGAVVCFGSFLLTITSSFGSRAFPMVLFGLTSVGIVVVFAGFVKIF